MSPALQAVVAIGGALALAACAGKHVGGTPALDQAGLGRSALLTASCSGCHAPGGRPGGIASLAGMSVAELEAKLLAYRNDATGDSAMHRMARGYSEQQISLIAAALGSP